MNILIVHNHYQIPGGEDQVAAQEAELLRAHGHKVITYYRDNSELKDFSLGQKILLPFRTIYNPRTCREIRKCIRENKIDVVHVHNTLMLVSPAVYYAAKKEKVPVVQTIHNFRLLCPGATFYRDDQICEDCLKKGLGCALKHKCYRGSFAQTLCCVLSMKVHRATGIYKRLTYICLTEFNKKKLLGLKGLTPEQIFVKPNAVSAPEALMPELERQDRFLFAARLEEMKGIRVLLEAWRLLGSNGPELLICGSGPLDEWSREFAADNKMTNVRFLGRLPNDQVRRLMATSRALILPTQWYEGFPMSIAESYSMGTPVLVSNLGNGGSLIKQGVTGLKFDPKSPQSIAKAVEKMEAEKNVNWEENTRRVYDQALTPEKNYAALMEVYAAAKERVRK